MEFIIFMFGALKKTGLTLLKGKDVDCMKKKLPGLCTFLSLVLVLGFIGKTILDYTRYQDLANSAPFSLWIEVNALIMLVPAALVFLLGLFIKKSGK